MFEFIIMYKKAKEEKSLFQFYRGCQCMNTHFIGISERFFLSSYGVTFRRKTKQQQHKLSESSVAMKSTFSSRIADGNTHG